MIKCEVIKSRKSNRFFDTTKPIEYKEIYDCLEAASKAPSPYNNQPWRFRVVVSKEKINELAAMLPHNKWVRTASAVIIVGCIKENSIERLKNYLAMGAAIENFMLEAQQHGIATCWMGECLGKGMEDQFEWPENYEIVSMIAMGYSRGYEIRQAEKKCINELLV